MGPAKSAQEQSNHKHRVGENEAGGREEKREKKEGEKPHFAAPEARLEALNVLLEQTRVRPHPPQVLVECRLSRRVLLSLCLAFLLALLPAPLALVLPVLLKDLVLGRKELDLAMRKMRQMRGKMAANKT